MLGKEVSFNEELKVSNNVIMAFEIPRVSFNEELKDVHAASVVQTNYWYPLMRN